MLVYIAGFLATIILLWLAQNKAKTKKTRILLMIIAVLPLLIISMLRYDVGTDYLKRYTHDYFEIAKGKDISNLEIGFKLIDYICLFFTNEPYLLFIITSLIIISIFFEVIYKESPNNLLSITIFFLAGYFFGSLNLIRQYISMGLILIAYQFLLQENKIKAYIGFTISIIFAFYMHSISIVGFVLIFLKKKVLVSAKWILPISIILLIVNENLMYIFSSIIEKTRFDVYLTGRLSKGEVSILNLFENLIVYIIFYITYYTKKKRGKELEQKATIFLNIQGIALIITALGACHMQFLRIALYFTVFQIISIPYYLEIIPFDEIEGKIKSKFKKEITKKTIKQIITGSVVIAFLGVFIYTNILNNDNEVVPYKTIFSQRLETE